jgi:hypothetical protein
VSSRYLSAVSNADNSPDPTSLEAAWTKCVIISRAALPSISTALAATSTGTCPSPEVHRSIGQHRSRRPSRHSSDIDA